MPLWTYFQDKVLGNVSEIVLAIWTKMVEQFEKQE